MDERLYAEQVRHFARVAPLAMTATVVNAVILAFFLRRQIAHSTLALWLGTVFLITLLRLPLFYRQALSFPSPSAAKRLGRWFTLGEAIAGLVWGAAAVFLFPIGSVVHEVFIAFVLGGMVAGAAGTLSVIMPAFLAYSLPAILPIIIRFLLLPGEIHTAMGIMAAVFLALMIPIAYRNSAILRDNFRLNFINYDLIAHLSEAKDKAEASNIQLTLEITERRKAEEALQRSQAELENKVAARTRELATANMKMAAEIAERARTEEKLKKTNELLERIFSTSFLKIAYLDPEFNFIRVNRAYAAADGRSPDEFPGKNHRAYAAADGRSPDEFPGKNHFDLYPNAENESIFRQAVATGQSISFQARPFINAAHPERGTTYWDWELIPIKGKQGEIKCLALFLIDVTDRIKAERNWRQAQKLEAIGTLAGGIAHDFNNILNVILGYTDLALRGLPADDPIATKLQKVKSASQRAADLVRQILAFSRLGGEEREPVRLQELIAEGVNLLRGTLPATISIETEISPDCRPVLGNSSQIHQIIMNLGTNAYHAMRRRGGVLSITLREILIEPPAEGDLLPGPYARLTVADTGQGINRKDLERIFDPYFTTKEIGRGTGLGLAIVHGIVKSHQGAIRAESEIGKGTMFEILLPVIRGKSIALEKRREPAPAAVAGRILFVDDEELIVQLGREMLEQLGLEVVTATTGREALEIFRQDPARFDLVITDQTMPELTGAELSEGLLEIRPGIPIILATGHSELIDEQQAKDLGIREFVMKPYTLAQLSAVVRRALGIKNME
ncbi:MAG: response regulator [Deltaproteobacteria bacterium]